MSHERGVHPPSGPVKVRHGGDPEPARAYSYDRLGPLSPLESDLFHLLPVLLLSLVDPAHANPYAGGGLAAHGRLATDKVSPFHWTAEPPALVPGERG